MKKIVILLVMIVTGMTMTAGNVTVEQAESIAHSFITERHPSVRSQSMRMAKRQALPMQVVADATAYYIFNVGTDNGFVIVSGSDLAPQVLGYAMQGSFKQEDIPSNMQAWLDGYAEQIAYLERTGGRNEAPRLVPSYEPISKLVKTTWGQGAPYYNSCPMDPVKNKRSATGCVATALAQILNYHQYPSTTIATIPGYTTPTRGIVMSDIDSTVINWDKMLNSYRSTSTTAQRNAVAKLMLLCGQAVKMDYTADGSGANDFLTVQALKQYFGYDKTVRGLNRKDFSTTSWEALIYDELAAGRPVLYGGQSMGGGHAFVIDGYDGNGMFHVNWGWDGQNDNFFLLSVLNPYNTTSTGASSTDDGFSFDQDAIVGIQHGTEEIIPERFTVYQIVNTGNSSYTRTSSSTNFTNLKMEVTVYNMTGENHSFMLGLALYNSNDEMLSVLGYADFNSLDYLYGGAVTFSSISFGARFEDGDYYFVPVSKTENSENWEPCWGSNVYRIKATIKGKTLKLTEPTINLSGTIETQGGAVNESVKVSAKIINNGSYFNDYVYLRVNNTIVGGRIFEAEEGDTIDFEIDFVPTTTGNKSVALAYVENNQYVPFATGSITINGANTIALSGTIETTNTVNNVVKEDKVSAVVTVTNNGTKYDNDVKLGLYKYNPDDTYYYETDNISQRLTLGSGEHTDLDFEFSNLENQQKYLLAFTYKKGNEWIDQQIYASFETQFEVSGMSAQEKKSWLFYEGLSDETIANLNADTDHWADNGNADGVTYNWKNIGKQDANNYWMANGQVIEELRGLKIDIGSYKDNSINLQKARNGSDGKIRLTRKNTVITFPKLANGQKITIQGRSSNSSATNRGIAPVQNYLQFQAEESSSQYNGACIFVGNQVEGSEGTYTFVWKVVTDQTDSVDVQFLITPDGGIDFTYFMIDNGDTPEMKDAQPVAYIYNGNLDNDLAYVYLGGSEASALTEINTAETTATADSLQKFQAVVVSPTIAADNAYLSTIKQAVAFVPMLNLNPNLYEALGYGNAVKTETNMLTIEDKENAAFEGFDVEEGLELLTEGGITGVTLGDYFANDAIVAKAGETIAMHIHNAKRNAYILLPLTLEDMLIANQDNIATLIAQVLQVVAGTKKDVTAVGAPVISVKQENGASTVSITAVNSKAIYYTLDGSEPTTESTLYTEPFTLTSPTTVKTFATGDGYTDSKVSEKEVVIKVQASVPTISVQQEQGKSVITLSSSEGIDVYFNFNGVATSGDSQLYTEPIEVTEPATIYALAEGGDYLPSELGEQTITVNGFNGRTSELLHFDANQADWLVDNTQNGGTGNASAYYFWGKSSWNYYSEEVDHEETVKDSEGNDSIVYYYKPNPDALKVINPNTPNGWVLKSEGQVLTGELQLSWENAVGNGRANRYAEEAIDFITTPTKGAITFGGKTSGDPYTARIETTDKIAGPFDVVVFCGNGNNGSVGVLEIQTSADGKTWNTLGTLKMAETQRYIKRTRVSFNETAEVFLRVAQVSGGTKAQIYDIIVLKSDGEQSDTDISQLDNVIYVEQTEALAGNETTLSIKMKNSAAIRGFQFDLYLPEGVTVAKNNKDRFVASLSDDRLEDGDEHTLAVDQQEDGCYRFLCGSLNEETFLGVDGEIATIKLNIAETMEDGDYPIYLRNIKLTENDISKKYVTEEVKSTLSIRSYTLGDINGDGTVDVSDYIGIANHILGNTPEGFDEKAADVNEDGTIDVSDYIGVANIILTGSIFGNQ